MNTEHLLQIRANLQNSLKLIDDELIKLDWRHLINREEYILAIKSYRGEHSVSLKEAKDAVDAFRELLKSY